MMIVRERGREGGREGERDREREMHRQHYCYHYYYYSFFVAVSFSFSRSDYSVPENGGSIILSVLKEGTTVQPLSIFIESFDITAYGKYTCTVHILIAYLSFLSLSSSSSFLSFPQLVVIILPSIGES